jgi:hypothetical protein
LERSWEQLGWELQAGEKEWEGAGEAGAAIWSLRHLRNESSGCRGLLLAITIVTPIITSVNSLHTDRTSNIVLQNTTASRDSGGWIGWHGTGLEQGD